jgi:hypothetical protein
MNGMGLIADTLVQTALSTATKATNHSAAISRAMPADVDQIQCTALSITGYEDPTAMCTKGVFGEGDRSVGFYPSILYRADDKRVAFDETGSARMHDVPVSATG